MVFSPRVPPKLRPGDRVAVVSPSFAAPGLFPDAHELAMRRLRDEIGLEPVEYPTTRRLNAPPQDRAADLNAAFADPSIRAVLATIGGDDQLTVLPFLDPELATSDPKPFFGYSDNTNLLNWLWHAGIAGYHGGSTMVHLGRGGELHPTSTRSLRAALFETVTLVLEPAAEFGEDDVRWDDPALASTRPPMTPGSGWTWHGPRRVVTGPTWGGNLEILQWVLGVNRWLRPIEDYAGCVLLLETSEEQPSAGEVYRILRTMGERGLLQQFPAALIARARATDFGRPRPPAERPTYRAEQQAAVLRAFEQYNPGASIVFDVDFGHTDPQWVLPYGGTMTVDSIDQRLMAHY
jgi:muramoyltetrapeptide carboxypeptidase LdcA involved in peptidoglycan recycling